MVAALQANKLAVGAGIDGLVVPAIRELSFDLEPGKILGLVGESGAGKSMVGRAIAQLLPPGFAITAGTLAFEGNDLLQMAQAQRRALLGRAIAFVPQAPLTALNPVLTIGALGYHLRTSGSRHIVLTSLLLVMWAGGIVLIADLNRPRIGTINVDPAPLQWTINDFRAVERVP